VAERWTVVATWRDEALVQVRHSDGVVWIKPDMSREESQHALAELGKSVLLLQQALAAR
jgi:hypothetical protein